MPATLTDAPASPTATIDHLARLYEFRDGDAVATFIGDNPEVVGALLDAVSVIPRYFGADTLLALEVARDPEAHDDVRLFAFIRIDLDVPTSLAGLRRFDEEWWAEAMGATNLKLMFDTEFR